MHDNSNNDNIAVQKTILLLMAAALNLLEFAVPRIPLFPWLKPGLANSITIIWIFRYSLKDALLFTVIRVWITSFFTGFSLLTIAFALSGGFLSTLAMAALWNLAGKNPKILGTIGIGITGAVFHNFGQLAAVYYLLTQNNSLWYQLPFMGLASLVFGGFTGTLVPLFWRVLNAPIPAQHLTKRFSPLRTSQSRVRIGGCFLVMGCAAAVVFVDQIIYLIAIAAASMIVAFTLRNRRFFVLVYPLRFWFLFLFIAIFTLPFSYGTRMYGIPFITSEGITATVHNSLRLWIWLEMSLTLHWLQCNEILFRLLLRLFPHHGPTFSAGVLALECFPDVILFVKSSESRKNLPWHTPAIALSQFTGRVQSFILDQLEDYPEGPQ